MNPTRSVQPMFPLITVRRFRPLVKLASNWIWVCFLVWGMGLSRGSEERMRLHFNHGFSLKVRVEDQRAYRLQWSEDLTNWQWHGDAFLPDPDHVVRLPKSARGFIRFVPTFKVPFKDLKIVIMGDSTIADLSFFGEMWNGWGQWMQSFFMDKAFFINLAEGGMSTSKFLKENRIAWADRIRPEVVLLQFGMVDQLDGFTPDTYEKNLGDIVDQVRGIGAIPVLVTPVAGRTFLETGEHVNELEAYAEAALRIAESRYTACVDLNRSSSAFYSLHGPDQTVMMTGCGNACPDRIHFSKAGSHIMAAIAIQDFPPMLKAYALPLQNLEHAMLQAFASDIRFDGLQTPFRELTGFQENQVWDWVFP